MKSLPLVAVLFFCVFTGNAQIDLSLKQLDSLTSLLTKAEGAEKFEVTFQLSRATFSRDIKKSFFWAKEAEKIANESSDSLRIVKSKYAQGYIYRRMDSLVQSLELLTEAIAIARRNKFIDQQTEILNAMAIGQTFLGNFDKALACHFEALEIHEKNDNKEDIGITCNNIGLVYFKMSDYENALNFYQKSLNVKNSISNGFDLGKLLVNMALCYNQLKRYQEAEDFIKRGLQICGNQCDSDLQMYAELGLGVASSEQGRKEDAIYHFESSLLIARHLNDKRFQIDNLMNLALVHESQQHPKEALGFLIEAEKIAVTTNYSLSLIEIYKLYSKIFRTQNDFQNASTYQSRYIALKDSIYSSDLIKNLAQVQANYAERENIKTINAKDEILALNAQLIARQKQQTVFIAVIALLLFLLAGVFYKNYRDKLLANHRLDEKVKERTEELRASHHRLDKSFSLQKLTMQQVWQEGQSILGSIKGLCHVALLDLEEVKAKEYVTKVDDSTGRLAALLARLNG
jgi:tetratricopeptide (TPR) repeat protein